jgi:hypothetical protein
MTRDHIPPRSLFSKPRPNVLITVPNDLITVPSCYFCNKGASKHDEYFNLVVKLGIDRNRFPNEYADSLDTTYNLARPKSLRFARSLLQGYRPALSLLELDRDRIGIVLHRIVRGLFYHDIRMRLPEFVPFRFVSISHEPRIAAALSSGINSLAKGLKSIGGGVFRYAFAQCAPPDPFVTAWLLSFYDHHRFFCFTSSDNAQE